MLKPVLKRIAMYTLNYLKLFLMPVLLAVFVLGCLYRLGEACIRALRS